MLTGELVDETYDVLILSPGASPIVPKLPGTDLPHVFTVRNVVDIERLQNAIVEKDAQSIAVIGGGFIGVEVAENLRLAGKSVSLVEFAPQILTPFDEDMVQILHKELVDQGVKLVVGDGLATITQQSYKNCTHVFKLNNMVSPFGTVLTTRNSPLPKRDAFGEKVVSIANVGGTL